MTPSRKPLFSIAAFDVMVKTSRNFFDWTVIYSL